MSVYKFYLLPVPSPSPSFPSLTTVWSGSTSLHFPCSIYLFLFLLLLYETRRDYIARLRILSVTGHNPATHTGSLLTSERAQLYAPQQSTAVFEAHADCLAAPVAVSVLSRNGPGIANFTAIITPVANFGHHLLVFHLRFCNGDFSKSSARRHTSQQHERPFHWRKFRTSKIRLS